MHIAKKVTLILIGSIPFFIGYGMNALILGVPSVALPFKLISIAALILWFLIGRYSYKLADTKTEAAVLGNAIAFVVLLLVLYQECILGQYWFNQLGAASQLYYVPFFGLAYIFTGMFHTMPSTYIAAFLMMCIVFYLGCLTSKKYTK